ncbi:MAG: hypothetical protein PHQ62_02360 [Clostridia bacterium]|nr:hypothetical protein [Clostridia bacterium]
MSKPAERQKPKTNCFKDFEEMLITKSSDQTPSESGVCEWSLEEKFVAVRAMLLRSEAEQNKPKGQQIFMVH